MLPTRQKGLPYQVQSRNNRGSDETTDQHALMQLVNPNTLQNQYPEEQVDLEIRGGPEVVTE